MGETRGVVLKLKTHASACQCNIVDSEVRVLWKQHTQSYYKLITNQLCGSIRRFAAVSKKIYSSQVESIRPNTFYLHNRCRKLRRRKSYTWNTEKVQTDRQNWSWESACGWEKTGSHDNESLGMRKKKIKFISKYINIMNIFDNQPTYSFGK